MKLRMSAWVCACAVASGCTTIYVDELGQRHVVGLVALTLPPIDGHSVGADFIRARSLGLTLTRSPIEDALVLGYSDITLAGVRNDSLVRLDGARSAGQPASANR